MKPLNPLWSPDSPHAGGPGAPGGATGQMPGLGSAPPGGGGGGPAAQGPAGASPSKIQAFEQRLGSRKGEEQWKRTPTITGHGAVHVRSFHCKLSEDAMSFLDHQVNEWLDAHPEFEVKHVCTTSGEWQGKIGREAHLIVQVWV